MTNMAPSVLFVYTDSVGIQRTGYIEKTLDHGGTDVTYFLRRWEAITGADRVDVLSGSRVKMMRCLNTRIHPGDA